MILEMQKEAISNLSDDKNLFRKEIIKALVRTKSNEKNEFKNWLLQNFGNTHGYMIQKVCEVIK